MTDVAVRGGSLPAGTISTASALVLPDGLSFREWAPIGELLDATAERVSWSLGDWRVYGERFADDREYDLAPIDRSNSRAFAAMQVSREFPPAPADPRDREVGQRNPAVSWTHHERLLRFVKDPIARETWLNEVLRHGWSVRELVDRLERKAITGERPPALSVRATGEVVGRFEARALALGVPAKDLALEVLQLASQLEDPIGVLETAGATREIGEAA